MKVDYSALAGAASSLSGAASRVTSEAAVSGELGSGSAGPDRAQSETAGDRKAILRRLGEVLEAQSRSCAEMVRLFQLLDAQIASQVISR